MKALPFAAASLPPLQYATYQTIAATDLVGSRILPP